MDTDKGIELELGASDDDLLNTEGTDEERLADAVDGLGDPLDEFEGGVRVVGL